MIQFTGVSFSAVSHMFKGRKLTFSTILEVEFLGVLNGTN